ncbi:hypothetical protein AVEN_84051-1, partial [Araneus ventricosus]
MNRDFVPLILDLVARQNDARFPGSRATSKEDQSCMEVGWMFNVSSMKRPPSGVVCKFGGYWIRWRPCLTTIQSDE